MVGVRTNVDVALQYLDAWLRGTGAVAIHNLMEDAATAEISRSQLWQWITHRVAVDVRSHPARGGTGGRARACLCVVLRVHERFLCAASHSTCVCGRTPDCLYSTLLYSCSTCPAGPLAGRPARRSAGVGARGQARGMARRHAARDAGHAGADEASGVTGHATEQRLRAQKKFIHSPCSLVRRRNIPFARPPTARVRPRRSALTGAPRPAKGTVVFTLG